MCFAVINAAQPDSVAQLWHFWGDKAESPNAKWTRAYGVLFYSAWAPKALSSIHAHIHAGAPNVHTLTEAI